MTTKAKTDKTEDKPAESPAEPETIERGPRECVVDDGTEHVGRAVNGLVCSRHAVHYRPDGTPRGK